MLAVTICESSFEIQGTYRRSPGTRKTTTNTTVLCVQLCCHMDKAPNYTGVEKCATNVVVFTFPAASLTQVCFPARCGHTSSRLTVSAAAVSAAEQDMRLANRPSRLPDSPTTAIVRAKGISTRGRNANRQLLPPGRHSNSVATANTPFHVTGRYAGRVLRVGQGASRPLGSAIWTGRGCPQLSAGYNPKNAAQLTVIR